MKKNDFTKFRIIYNDDTCTLRDVKKPHTREKISLVIDYLKDTQVDCLSWLVAEDVAYSYPSSVIENRFDVMKKNGLKNHGDLMYNLYLKGIDYLPLLIEKTHNYGIQFFASFRMNDTHLKSKPSSVLTSEFWRQHQHYRLWEVINGKTYYNAALDYSYPEVRKRRIDVVNEVANTYDVNGIELDFCRSPYLFQPSEGWSKRNILTTFIKKIRKNLISIGKKKISLIIRVPFGEERLMKAGMDVRKWIKGKYLDILVMSNITNNYNQNLEPWLSLCRENDILLYPSVEAGPAIYDHYRDTMVCNPTAPAHNHVIHMVEPESPNIAIKRQRAAAQNFLAQGADGIYMFNYPCRLFEGKRNKIEDSRIFKTLVSILSQLGSLKTMKNTDKQYTFWQDLPISLESSRPPQYHQTIKFNIFDSDLKNKNTKVILRFRQVAEKNPHVSGKYWQNPVVPRGVIRYYLNGEEIKEENIKRRRKPKRKIPSGFKLRLHELIELTLPGNKIKAGENSLAFHIPHFPRERDPYVYIYEFEVDNCPL